MRLIHLLLLLTIVSLCACADRKTKARPLPFTSVGKKGEKTWHTLSLPDGDRLLIRTKGDSIVSVSATQKGGTAFSADYEAREYFTHPRRSKTSKSGNARVMENSSGRRRDVTNNTERRTGFSRPHSARSSARE